MKILPPVSIEARRLLPSRWDLLAAALVLGFLCLSQIGVSATPPLLWPIPSAFLTGSSAAIP